VGFTYDADGQITRKTYSGGTHVDYQYDARGNLTSATDATGTTTLTYNANDYLTRIDYPGPGGRWLAYTYDSGGRRATSTDQLGHQLHYQYDAVGRLSRITDESSAQVVLYEYDAAGRMARKTLGNGVYTTYDYDAAGQLLHLVNHKADATVLSRFDYSYDSRGRRVSMGTLDGAWTYGYDDIGQLTRAVFVSTNPAIADQDLLYVYDAMGNRIRTVENGVATTYTTNNLNQYTQVGNTTYTFDADGNLVSETSPSGTVLYSYDDENRLIAVQKGADAWAYTYDAFSQRVAAKRNGVTTHYTIDPIGLGNMVGEYDQAGDLVGAYVYGFDLLSRTSALGGSVWYTFDALGSTSELSNPLGGVVSNYVYLPFGAVLEATGSMPNTFLFVGAFGVSDEGNGLSYMRGRFSSTGLARFVGVDPIGLIGGDVNLQRYVENNPISNIDPSGLQANCEYKYGGWIPTHRYVQDKDGWQYHYGPATLWDFFTGRGRHIKIRIRQDGTYEGGVLGYGYYCYADFKENCWGQSERDYKTYCAPSKDPADPPEPPKEPLGGGAGGIGGAVDPNQKLGPSGFGPAGYITPSTPLPYRIDFENDATATAPAQNVTITDQLDADLDWSTFALTEVGFGDHLIAVPANTQYFETTVPVHYNNQDFEVQIEVGINLATGQVFAHFFSVDPNTSLPPDVLTGFLPPEDGTGRGMGYIAYRIDQKPGLITGTELRNIALISFDGQPWIATNQVDPHDPAAGIDPAKEALNTIDAGAPTSAVVSLQSTRTAPDFDAHRTRLPRHLDRHRRRWWLRHRQPRHLRLHRRWQLHPLARRHHRRFRNLLRPSRPQLRLLQHRTGQRRPPRSRPGNA